MLIFSVVNNLMCMMLERANVKQGSLTKHYITHHIIKS